MASSAPSGPFTTPLTVVGPLRSPAQMLDQQSYEGHASVHDEATAGSMGLAGAPIEGPTHFSQIDPLAYACWGRRWFETGCVSSHFKTMVVAGEQVSARLEAGDGGTGRITVAKADGTPVLEGTATVDPDLPTELGTRVATFDDPGELFIVDQLHVGQRSAAPVTSVVDLDTPNGSLYPFSLRQKLERITEPSDWYSSDDTPWGRPVLPMEMISVLAQKGGNDFTVRGPALGLFIDLEIRLVAGPVFVGQPYRIEREVVALGQSRRTESYWVRSTLTDESTGELTASVLLHSGVFKQSYAGYPADKL